MHTRAPLDSGQDPHLSPLTQPTRESPESVQILAPVNTGHGHHLLLGPRHYPMGEPPDPNVKQMLTIDHSDKSSNDDCERDRANKTTANATTPSCNHISVIDFSLCTPDDELFLVDEDNSPLKPLNSDKEKNFYVF